MHRIQLLSPAAWIASSGFTGWRCPSVCSFVCPSVRSSVCLSPPTHNGLYRRPTGSPTRAFEKNLDPWDNLERQQTSQSPSAPMMAACRLIVSTHQSDTLVNKRFGRWEKAPKCIWVRVCLDQGRLYVGVGGGTAPPNLDHAPPTYFGYNSQHTPIRWKRNSLLHITRIKFAVRTPLGVELTTLPRCPILLRHTPFAYPHPRDVHGNGNNWNPMSPMGFPWEWEWQWLYHGNGSRNKSMGMGI